DEYRRLANDHLWLHFTNMHGHEPPIIVRGEGCYLEDVHGKRYLDALAGLFSVNLGYGYGEEIGLAAHEQMRELPFYTNWTYAHRRRASARAVQAPRARGAPREQHEPLPPAPGGDGRRVHGPPPRGARADDPGDGPGDGLPDPHGADPERRGLLHRAGGLLAR